MFANVRLHGVTPIDVTAVADRPVALEYWRNAHGVRGLSVPFASDASAVIFLGPRTPCTCARHQCCHGREQCESRKPHHQHVISAWLFALSEHKHSLGAGNCDKQTQVLVPKPTQGVGIGKHLDPE